MFVVHNLKKNVSLGFVHIPRTGGTSFYKTIYQWASMNDHIRVDNIDHHCKAVEMPYSDHMTSTIRNPWERLISLYFLLKAHHEIRDNLFVIPPKLIDGMYPDFLSWSRDIEKYRFKYFSAPNYNLTHNPLTTQCDFLRGRNIDFLCRFENLQRDVDRVFELIGCDVPLPITNATKHNHYSTYYNEETKAMVERYFKEDIDTFGYTFDQV